jgi:putative transposase
LKINLSQAFAGQRVGVTQVEDKIWLVSFMRYDLGFFDHETCRIESAANPFAAKLSPTGGRYKTLPIYPEWTRNEW